MSLSIQSIYLVFKRVIYFLQIISSCLVFLIKIPHATPIHNILVDMDLSDLTYIPQRMDPVTDDHFNSF